MAVEILAILSLQCICFFNYRTMIMAIYIYIDLKKVMYYAIQQLRMFIALEWLFWYSFRFTLGHCENKLSHWGHCENKVFSCLINMGFDRGTRRELQLKKKVRALQAEESELLAKLEYLQVEDFFLQMKNAILKICLEETEQQIVKREELNQEMLREIAQIKAKIQQGQSQGSGHRRK